VNSSNCSWLWASPTSGKVTYSWLLLRVWIFDNAYCSKLHSTSKIEGWWLLSPCLLLPKHEASGLMYNLLLAMRSEVLRSGVGRELQQVFAGIHAHALKAVTVGYLSRTSSQGAAVVGGVTRILTKLRIPRRCPQLQGPHLTL
jgi:hypothetical protein